MRLSATQIRTWLEQCQMLWWIKYIEKKRPPATDAQSEGEAIHAVLEDYIKDGVYPDLKDRFGRIASHALHLLPIERAMQSEVRFSELPNKPECDYEFSGVIDLLCLDGDVPMVKDFKTTRSRRWMKASYQLKSDIQLMLYAAYALANAPQATRCEIGLIYIGKDPAKPFAHEVSDIASRDEVDLFWNSVILQAAREIEMAIISSASDMQRNYDFCPAFGGCKVMDYCEMIGINNEP